MSERERFRIEASYYLTATGELEKAAQVYELWQQTYPRDFLPYAALGFIYTSLGNLEKALEEAREAMRLEPNNGANYVQLSPPATRASTGWMRRRRCTSRRRSASCEVRTCSRTATRLAFLKGDTAQMAQLASAAMGKPGTEDLLLATQADTEAWYGKLKERTRADPAGDGFSPAQRRQRDRRSVSGSSGAARGGIGQPEQARADADAALKLAPNRDVRAMAALALARAGDTARAEKLAAELDKTFPLDTLVQSYWLPTIRAAVALERKDPNARSRTIEGGEHDRTRPAHADQCIPVSSLFAGRSLSHAARRQRGGSRISEVHRPLRTGGELSLGSAGPPRPGSRLRARATTDPAARDKARTAYQNFLTLWKDADPDIPIYKQAQSRVRQVGRLSSMNSSFRHIACRLDAAAHGEP